MTETAEAWRQKYIFSLLASPLPAVMALPGLEVEKRCPVMNVTSGYCRAFAYPLCMA